ncbi:MAG: homocysteine S-methyltransferase family protein [Myxococcota bacterium]
MDSEPRAFASRLHSRELLVLDGATGTELERRGVATQLPLWSAAAIESHPEVLAEIHADYAARGVDALTANTFRTQRRTLARSGRADVAGAWTTAAVAIARRAAGHRLAVLGSCPTLEDCYRPDRVPEADALATEHAEHTGHLARAGVDGILVETMNTQREAVAATRAAIAHGLPVITTFVCWEGPTLLSGEPLADALRAAADVGADVVGVNCLPASNALRCLDTLAASDLPFAVYANLGEPEDEQGFRRSEALSPDAFAQHAHRWCEAGARIVGGCCGTEPAHLEAVVSRLR